MKVDRQATAVDQEYAINIGRAGMIRQRLTCNKDVLLAEETESSDELVADAVDGFDVLRHVGIRFDLLAE